MFWNVRVRVSEQSYRFSLPIIYIFRIFGLFPIKIERDNRNVLYMQWSPLYATYSYLLELILHVTTYLGVIIDCSVPHSRSVRVHSSTDLFVNIVDVAWVQIGMFFLVSVVSAKFLQFFAYVRRINEIDHILQTTHSKWERLKQFCGCFGWWLVVFLLHLLDYIMYIVTLGKKLGSLWILKLYFSHYISCVVLMFGEYQYHYLGDSLTKRITRLNKILKTFFILGSKEAKIQNPEKRIGILMETYLKLADAAQHQNRLLGEASVIITALAFWHLVVAIYFLFSEMTEPEPHPVTLTVWVMLILFHTTRLLMVTESWHLCCVEAETTKNWVCKLHCSYVGRQIRKKLRTFQTILYLKKIEFSLAGFCVIDRTLVTSLLGSVMTYVIVLLQYRAKDSKE